jgi:hypothetical protein
MGVPVTELQRRLEVDAMDAAGIEDWRSENPPELLAGRTPVPPLSLCPGRSSPRMGDADCGSAGAFHSGFTSCRRTL